MPDLPSVPFTATGQPFEVRAAIEAAVAQMVPADKHVAIAAVLTPTGPRFVAAARLDDHWSIDADVTLAHGDGTPWAGQIAICGVY